MTTRGFNVRSDAPEQAPSLHTSPPDTPEAPHTAGAPGAAPAHGHATAHPQDVEGAKMGMWLFLFTEILLFGGLFLLFAVSFSRHAAEFHEGGLDLNRMYGTINTVVLITSSLFVALAVGRTQRGDVKAARFWLLLTIVCALIFLCIKYVEWSTKIGHGIYPGGPTYLAMPPGRMSFFNLYYLMTGLHALHVIIGGAVLFWVRCRMGAGLVHKDRYVLMENAGLYWHVVDLIWIYLFPLFYLVM